MGKSKKSINKDAPIGDTILAALRGSKDGKSMELKPLRKSVLLAAQIISDPSDDIDKASKKFFKEAVKSLESSGSLTLSAEGVVKLSKTERKKEKDKDKKKKKDKKRSREKDVEEERADEGSQEDEGDDDDGDATQTKKQKSEQPDEGAEEEAGAGDSATANEDDDGWDAGAAGAAGAGDNKKKNQPCKGNPQGTTRLFVGNLPFTVDEATLKTHLLETVTHIKWITDKETGKFYGSAFVEMRNSRDASQALTEVNGTKLLGRPVKINFAPARDGEDWPPRSSVITGGKKAGGQAGGSGVKAMGVKPEDCKKLFIGNLSYEIDDDAIAKFFMTVEAELKDVRWLHHQESGDFKGCGFAEFWNAAACEKAATLNGKDLLGRPIRIDWTE